jgi:hypothetical protein
MRNLYFSRMIKRGTIKNELSSLLVDILVIRLFGLGWNKLFRKAYYYRIKENQQSEITNLRRCYVIWTKSKIVLSCLSITSKSTKCSWSTRI